MNAPARTLQQRLRRLRVLWHLALRGSDREFTAGPIRRAVFLLAVPMVLETALEAVFAITDIFWVAHLGADAVTAVGLSEALEVMVYAVAEGLAVGTTAMVARRFGEKDRDGAALAAGQALWIGAAFGLFVGLAGVFYAEQLLRLMGASDSVVAIGSGYTMWLLGGSITVVYLFLINAIFRGAADAAIAMRSLWLANAINIVLDPLLIFGIGPFPELGVTGAAIATTVGRGCGVLYQVWVLTRATSRIRIGLRHLALQLPLMWRLMRVSRGGILQILISHTSWVALVRIVAEFGSAAVAGYTIAVRIVIFTILPAWGMSNAAATLVGQNLGAGKPQRAEDSAWLCMRYNLALMVALGLALIVFADPLIGLFSPSAEVHRIGVHSLRIMAAGYGFFAVGMVMVQAINGAGDTDTPMVINFFCFWLLQIPLGWILALPAGMGPDGVFVAVVVAEGLMAAIAAWIFRRGRWKLRTV